MKLSRAEQLYLHRRWKAWESAAELARELALDEADVAAAVEAVVASRRRADENPAVDAFRKGGWPPTPRRPRHQGLARRTGRRRTGKDAVTTQRFRETPEGGEYASHAAWSIPEERHVAPHPPCPIWAPPAWAEHWLTQWERDGRAKHPFQWLECPKRDACIDVAVDEDLEAFACSTCLNAAGRGLIEPPERPASSSAQSVYLEAVSRLTEETGAPPSLRDVARVLRVTKSAARQMVAKLEALGLLAPGAVARGAAP